MSRPKAMSKHDKATVIKLLAEHGTTKGAAKALGVCQDTLSQYCRRQKIELPKRPVGPRAPTSTREHTTVEEDWARLLRGLPLGPVGGSA